MGDLAPLPATIVVPTVGRPSLGRLVEALATGTGPAPEAMVVVDDRTPADRARDLALPAVPWSTRVVSSGGRGPAAARNAGWRVARTPWVAFLDDDVEPEPDWRERLPTHLNRATGEGGGSQRRGAGPPPADRGPHDPW